MAAATRSWFETVRLGAARAVIEMGTRLREAVELEERIASLESGHAAQGRVA